MNATQLLAEDLSGDNGRSLQFIINWIYPLLDQTAGQCSGSPVVMQCAPLVKAPASPEGCVNDLHNH